MKLGGDIRVLLSANNYLHKLIHLCIICLFVSQSDLKRKGERQRDHPSTGSLHGHKLRYSV